MPVPNPEVGLVVQYEYTWAQPQSKGSDRKPRPSCIVVCYQEQPDENDPKGPPETKVVYLPISHYEPDDHQHGIELSAHAKKAAGLDALRQWIVVSECNIDTWPFDIQQLPREPGKFHYGYLPPNEFEKIKEAFMEYRTSKKLTIIPRL